jgi:hypothetical protein
LSWRFWNDARNGTAAEKLQLVMRHLTLMTVPCRISKLKLPRCDVKGQDAERLAGVLAQCPALTHLNLRYNYIRAGWAGRLQASWCDCDRASFLLLEQEEEEELLRRY